LDLPTRWAQFRSLRNGHVLKINMRKSPVATKTLHALTGSKNRAHVKEQEQLYLVRKSERGAPGNGNGFRHHRPKEKRADAPAPRVLDPANAQIDYADNERGAINKLLALNEYYRLHPWPAPFDRTEHRLRLGDARDLSWIPNGSVHLIVTSPPYWTLKKYEKNECQLGEIEDYNAFLAELDKVWRECARVLAPGGRICCVAGDVCIPRKQGRHLVMPLHADIMVRARSLGLDALTPILWFKIANGVTEAKGNGSGFYGKPYQPGAIIKNDVEYILFLRKGGEYRSPSSIQKALSMLTKDEMKSWLRSAWVDIKGESTRRGHPAPYPQTLAERLIKLFSFAGDTILDPFVGTGTTNLAAVATGRNSIGNEIEPAYLKIAKQRIQLATAMPRMFGATHATLHVAQ
jgi:modification methylase